MKKTLQFIIGSIFALFTSSSHTQAQGCCTPGTASLAGVERSVASFKTLITTLSYQHNSLDDAYESTRQIVDPLRRTATVEIASFELEYGIADRTSILMIASYLNKSRELTVKSASGAGLETASFTGSGFGDLVLLGKYQLVSPTLSSPLEVSIGGGAKLPIGRYRQEVNGTRLSIDLQAGTGATDLLAWAFVLKSFPRHSLRFFGDGLYRYTGTNLDGYRFGDELLVTVGVEYGVLEYLDLSLLLRARFAKQDFASGRLLPSTGGEMYSVAPNFTYREGKFALQVYAQLPVYRYVKGIQLSLTRLLGFQLQYVFDLGGESNLEDPK